MREQLRRTASSAAHRAATAGQGQVVAAYALVAALFCAVGLFHTSSRIAVVKSGYELGQIEQRYRELVRENEHLTMERATLRAAPRLESIARSRLNMAPPAASQIFTLRDAAPAVAASRAQKTAALASLPRAEKFAAMATLPRAEKIAAMASLPRAEKTVAVASLPRAKRNH